MPTECLPANDTIDNGIIFHDYPPPTVDELYTRSDCSSTLAVRFASFNDF